MKALITGASSGIGKELTKLLANDYNDLVLVGRNIDKLEELKKELIEQNTNCNFRFSSS